MSNTVIAYQTLEDKDNIDEIETDGPFPCSRPDAWLGYGYYFWDTNIDWAMSWGINSYNNKGKDFIIGRCLINLSNDCFDLVGCVQHWSDFIEVIKVMKESKKIKNPSEEVVANIITFMRRNDIFQYNSIRAADDYKASVRIPFIKGRSEFMTINKRVQICVINKKDVLLRPFSVVYPEKYLI
jgi:hypothetical protein